MRNSIILSVLIPVYNWDIRDLLQRLQVQSLALQGKCEIEIIVIDDGSVDTFDMGSIVSGFPFVRYEALSENRGRVAVRNRLLERAAGEYILFLDADMLPDSDIFLQKYIQHAEAGDDIVCGGISYTQSVHDNDFSFYLYKSSKTEAVPAEIRNSSPWKYLFTSNIMLRRKIVESVRFDPRFEGYGFEDIEWAIRLWKSYTINHIDNTCSHMGLLRKNQVFERMRDSISNYALLLFLHPEETEQSAAARSCRLLQILPDRILGWMDAILVRLFYRFSWNPLVFVIFQCTKTMLLAQALKNRKRKHPIGC